MCEMQRLIPLLDTTLIIAKHLIEDIIISENHELQMQDWAPAFLLQSMTV